MSKKLHADKYIASTYFGDTNSPCKLRSDKSDKKYLGIPKLVWSLC